MRSPCEPNLAPLLEAASPPYAECGFVCGWDYHDGIVHYCIEEYSGGFRSFRDSKTGGSPDCNHHEAALILVPFEHRLPPWLSESANFKFEPWVPMPASSCQPECIASLGEWGHSLGHPSLLSTSSSGLRGDYGAHPMNDARASSRRRTRRQAESAASWL